MQDLLAQDLVYVHSTGLSDRRDSYLAKLSSGSLKYLELNFSGLQAQLLQHVAVVSARMAAAILKDGQRKELASCFMTVWACEADGVWRLQAHQGTALPSAGG